MTINPLSLQSSDNAISYGDGLALAYGNPANLDLLGYQILTCGAITIPPEDANSTALRAPFFPIRCRRSPADCERCTKVPCVSPLPIPEPILPGLALRNDLLKVNNELQINNVARILVIDGSLGLSELLAAIAMQIGTSSDQFPDAGLLFHAYKVTVPCPALSITAPCYVVLPISDSSIDGGAIFAAPIPAAP